MDALGRTHVELSELIHARLWLSRLPDNKSKSPASTISGQHLARLHGQSTEFDQVRDYQHGDDARHIDWRASARAGAIQTRLFRRERDRPVFILVEQSPAMFFASCGNFKSVQAALVASLFAWAASSVHDRIGGLVFGRPTGRLTPPARNRQGALQLLDNICRENQRLNSPFPTDNSNPLQQALEQCRPHLLPGCLLILVCSEQHLSPDAARQLGTLAIRHESIWLPVSDPLEHLLPHQQGLAFAGQQQQLFLQQQHSSLSQGWQQQARQTRALWQQLATKHQTILLPVCTSSCLSQQLPGLQEGLHVIST